MSKLANKVALVTGAASGVGRACAVRFATLGFDVVVNYYGENRGEAEQTVSLVEGKGVRSLLAQCDVSKDVEVASMVDEIEACFGRLDVVVNSAGVTHFVDPTDFDGMTEEKWDQILAVNTKGPFFIIRAALPLLRKGESAAIVNISSAAGASGIGSSIAYSASKGALNTMTKSLAQALAPDIRVNAVCPGPIDSDWLRRGMTEEAIQDRVSKLPIPELVSPDDVADAVAYLAVETSKTTGQLLTIDCGRSM